MTSHCHYCGTHTDRIKQLEGEKAELQLCYDSAFARAEQLEEEIANLEALLASAREELLCLGRW